MHSLVAFSSLFACSRSLFPSFDWHDISIFRKIRATKLIFWKQFCFNRGSSIWKIELINSSQLSKVKNILRFTIIWRISYRSLPVSRLPIKHSRESVNCIYPIKKLSEQIFLRWILEHFSLKFVRKNLQKWNSFRTWSRPNVRQKSRKMEKSKQNRQNWSTSNTSHDIASNEKRASERKFVVLATITSTAFALLLRARFLFALFLKNALNFALYFIIVRPLSNHVRILSQ